MAAMIAYFLTLGGVLPVSANNNMVQIEFNVMGDDDTTMGPDYGKGSVLMPTVWQDGYLLDFQGSHDDYVLRIVDSTNTVVYSTAVPSYQTQVWLPSTLSGDYAIELVMGNWLFTGWINL